jgi:hypothetical protein
VNVFHFDTSRLTPPGWTLHILSWLSLVGLFVLERAGAPKAVLVVTACVFFVALLVAKVLDYAGDAIHKPGSSKSEESTTAAPSTERRGGDV